MQGLLSHTDLETLSPAIFDRLCYVLYNGFMANINFKSSQIFHKYDLLVSQSFKAFPPPHCKTELLHCYLGFICALLQ